MSHFRSLISLSQTWTGHLLRAHSVPLPWLGPELLVQISMCPLGVLTAPLELPPGQDSRVESSVSPRLTSRPGPGAGSSLRFRHLRNWALPAPSPRAARRVCLSAPGSRSLSMDLAGLVPKPGPWVPVMGPGGCWPQTVVPRLHMRNGMHAVGNNADRLSCWCCVAKMKTAGETVTHAFQGRGSPVPTSCCPC